MYDYITKNAINKVSYKEGYRFVNYFNGCQKKKERKDHMTKLKLQTEIHWNKEYSLR